MTMPRLISCVLIISIFSAACNREKNRTNLSACSYTVVTDSSKTPAAYSSVRGALLGTRFTSFDELRSVINIEYFNDNKPSDSTIHKNASVCIKHCSNGKEVTGILKAGTNETDISNASKGNFKEQFTFMCRSPYAVAVRKDLEKIFLLSRLRPALFGEGDVAFFNLAETTFHNINTPDLAFVYPKDTTEKGYLNTFNHMTAQAFITSCFSEELADFVADAHERAGHPKLILGKFTDKELKDLGEGPVDNYVDIINNEWGQELGKELKKKYSISRETRWTPAMLANYLNDMQSYYSWAFQIGFKPFRPEDEEVIKFSRKMNAVMDGASYAKFE